MVKMFNDIGYSATFLRLDTKNYYVPQTRQRGYLFAVKRHGKSKKCLVNVEDSTTETWKKIVEGLKRPASATLDDFMLANDDPRVLRGRAHSEKKERKSVGLIGPNVKRVTLRAVQRKN
jgi:site-specific DNA-cytosine methylase